MVRPFPNVDAGAWTLSSSGGTGPIWSPDAREIFFVNRSHDVVAERVEQNSSRPFTSARSLFHLSADVYLVEEENYTPYDISPDGSRFLMVRRVATGQRRATHKESSTATRAAVWREIILDFNSAGTGLRDASGLGIGFTSRLPGSGSAYAVHDSSFSLDPTPGRLQIRTGTAYIDGQKGMAQLEAPAIALSELGFTGAEDFSVSATFVGIPDDSVLDMPDQVGVFVGSSTTQLVRAGLVNLERWAPPTAQR